MLARIVPIARKELRSYFNSPIAYIVIVSFLVFSTVWLFYLQQFFAANQASLRPLFNIIPVVFIFILPALTMRSWAEEKKLGTLEVLLTLPYREGELVVGKFLASLGLLFLMMLLTLPVPLLLSRFGAFDWGEILAQYLGVLLIGSAELSLGLFVSAMASNQISAFILSCFALLALTLVSSVNSILNLPPWAAGFFNYLSPSYHFSSFQKGLVDSRDLFYYLIASGLFLYLNVKTLIFSKWL